MPLPDKMQQVIKAFELLKKARTPYEALGIDEGSSDEIVKKKYMETILNLYNKIPPFHRDTTLLLIDLYYELLTNTLNTLIAPSETKDTASIIQKWESLIHKIKEDEKRDVNGLKGTISKFTQENFYSKKINRVFNDLAVLPYPPAVVLIAQYYTEKYNASISLSYQTVEDFFKNFEKEINNLRKLPDDCRVAFLIGNTLVHMQPIIYIKEKGNECILLADSTGKYDNVDDLKSISKANKIDFYVVDAPRQADDFSCRLDALIFGRDITGHDLQSGGYRIPNLLSHLKRRSTKTEEHWYTARLPDELLKTSQISAFTTANRESSDRKIHKNETLTGFHERYKRVGLFHKDGGEEIHKDGGEEKKYAGYLHTKSFKLLTAIEIQFYLNELKRELGNIWTKEIRRDFIHEAKKIMLNPLLTEVQQKSELLYTFTKQFLETTLKTDISATERLREEGPTGMSP